MLKQDPTFYVAKASNWFCRHVLFFPNWICDNDRVLYHQTDTPQSVFELTCTGVIHFTSTFVGVTALDYLVIRPLTRYMQQNYKPKYQEIKRADLREKQDSPASPTASQIDVLKSPQTMAHEHHQQQQEKTKTETAPTTETTTVVATKTDPRKVSWFLLHAAFNLMVGVLSAKDALTILRDPLNGAFTAPKWNGSSPSSLFCAVAIGSFHAHHSWSCADLLTTEDIIHHGVNAGAVVLIGLYCPFGNMTALSNSAMCAWPGGIIYACLWWQKLGFTTRLQYKNVNRWLNLLMRYPIQLITQYIGLFHAFGGHNIGPDVPLSMRCLMLVASFLHSANSVYYCDQVVGSYYLEQADVRRRERDQKLAETLLKNQQQN